MPEPSTSSVVPALEMRGIAAGSIRDANTIVVEDVNWSVADGDFWVIGGLQGAGKTDFLMMTGGLTPPVRGTYQCRGAQMPVFEDARLRDRLRLGLVFEGGQLLNHLTVSENISLPLRYHRNLSKPEAAPLTQRMMDLTELAPWADSTPGALGRNWQKRVGLARALMLQPDVLLVDNPLGGLDLRHRAWWLHSLQQLSRGHDWMEGRRMTIVVAADDFRPWRGQARCFAMLKEKRLVVLGSWEELVSATDELVRELMAAGAPQSV